MPAWIVKSAKGLCEAIKSANRTEKLLGGEVAKIGRVQLQGICGSLANGPSELQERLSPSEQNIACWRLKPSVRVSPAQGRAIVRSAGSCLLDSHI